MDDQELTDATIDVAPSSAGEAVGKSGAPALDGQQQASLDMVIDLPVQLTVEIGRTRMLLKEVLEIGNGSVLELDRGSNEPVDVLVNGRIVAKGDLTSVDDRLAVRIVELVRPGDDQ